MMIFFILMNISFIKKHTDGFYFLMWAIPTTFGIAAGMYVTWLNRFSGNANMFYF